jgi:hypothetical protein
MARGTIDATQVDQIVGRLDLMLTNFDLAHPLPPQTSTYARLCRLRDLHRAFCAEVDALDGASLQARDATWTFRAAGAQAQSTDPLQAYRTWRTKVLRDLQAGAA